MHGRKSWRMWHAQVPNERMLLRFQLLIGLVTWFRGQTVSSKYD